MESKWQDMRKHAKREYMREVSVFEQSTRVSPIFRAA